MFDILIDLISILITEFEELDPGNSSLIPTAVSSTNIATTSLMYTLRPTELRLVYLIIK
jgi:hypothetical protein